MREHASDARDYEMMVVIAPTVSEEGLPAAVERVSGYIANQGGEVASAIHENPWGRRRLAYPIEDHRDAFYVLYRFNAAANAVVEIEREIKLDETIIRHLIVRYDQMTEHVERAPRFPQGEGQQAGSVPFRRSSQAGAPAVEASEQPEEEATASPMTSAEQDEPVESEAAAVVATRSGDTEASVETVDPGEEEETDATASRDEP